MPSNSSLVRTVDEALEPWGPAARRALLETMADTRFVLLGEATHGTHEFYQSRAGLTQALIEARKCDAVAVEADWPDAYRVHRYVRGDGDDRSAEEALQGFRRFPTWMWRNRDVVHFVEWLRDFNAALSAPEKVGFYGIDLYSLYTSMEAVIRFLDGTDPDAAVLARRRYGCFDQFGDEAQAYGAAIAQGFGQSCEKEVIAQLLDIQQRAVLALRQAPTESHDEMFYIEQNARLVTNAERYYRAMFQGRISTWNLRDRHMVETLYALADHLGRRMSRPRLAVWAHNSHLGDARATASRQRGEWNVGQLVREREHEHAFLLGFTTYTGTVTAASDWGAPARVRRVRPALPESFEALFHEAREGNFLVNLRARGRLKLALGEPRLERAIGVLYLPESERWSHYFEARLSDQFDAVIHFDETRAVEPLESWAPWSRGDETETFPSAV